MLLDGKQSASALARARLATAALALGCALSGCVCRRSDAAPHKPSSPATAVKALDVHCPGALAAARQGGTDPDRYQTPSEETRAGIRDAVAALLVTDPASLSLDTARAAARRAGFELVEVREANAVLLREVQTLKRGGGAYLIRPASASRIVVQAPHTFFDEGTLPLACELFERTQAAALFIDTAHRYKAAPQTPEGTWPADVAHARDSNFQAATEGLLRARPKSVVVQLHGFAERESGSAMVLSGGVKDPSVPIVARAFTALDGVVDGAVARYPAESSELGATSNVQGTIVRDAGGQFLHVEIAAPLRRQLLSDPTSRARVLAALADALEGA